MNMDLNITIMGIAGLLGVIAIILAVIELIRKNAEAKRQEKEMFDKIENIDTKALLGIERELKGIRGSLKEIEIVYVVLFIFLILSVIRWIF